MQPIRTCTELFVARRGLEGGAGATRRSGVRGAALKALLWRKQTLVIAFLDGDPALKQRVVEAASIWEQVCSIRFSFKMKPTRTISDARITFNQEGSWSFVGTDATHIPQNEPTICFGWLTPDSDDEELNRVVVHEFGHLLGLIHEHQNPQGGINWNKPAVLDYYQGPPNHWSPKDVDVNVFQKYNANELSNTTFDPLSIMAYPIPTQFVLDPTQAVGWNTVLSATDKEFVHSLYPPTPTR